MNRLQHLALLLLGLNVAVAGSGQAHFDSKFASTLDKQLEHVKAKTYDVVYPALKARQVIPVSNEVDPGATTIVYRQWDEFGVAKVISSYADDLPNVDALVEEFRTPVRSIGASYQYSIQDLRASAMAGSQLELKRARAARRAIENSIEEIAAFGIPNSGGVRGFFNHPNVPVATLPTNGWATATADQMIADLNFAVNAVISASKETFLPDSIVMDIDHYTILATKRVSTTGDSGTTVLKQFLENNPWITSVTPWYKARLANAAGSGARMVVYKKDPEVLTLEIPQEFEQFPPQQAGLAFKIPCHARIGGVIITYPFAMRYADLT